MALINEPQNTPETKFPTPSNVQWGALSRSKIAEITLCDKDGKPLMSQDGSILDTPIVEALLTEGDLSIESQYQSPFENSNPESKMPTLLGMLQSGELVAAVGKVASKEDNIAGQLLSGLSELSNPVASILGFDNIKDAVTSLEGRTNLTKVNSTQIFVSTAPIRMSVTLFFMALKDAKKEVEDQIMLLQQWALPIELSDSTALTNLAKGDYANVLFPSKVPPFISLTYSGKTYLPFVIESVSSPIVGPTDGFNRLSLSVTMTIASRQAWDASNVRQLYGAQ
ncbi:MAG: hypothetical protein EOO68_07970 [Moraxellaceae bacterium]|nr:MAG: hypothetical protein EOO68_07970 [Moraxellaceae bacterium]